MGSDAENPLGLTDGELPVEEGGDGWNRSFVSRWIEIFLDWWCMNESPLFEPLNSRRPAAFSCLPDEEGSGFSRQLLLAGSEP